MNKGNRDQAYFISFCIEQYKNEKGLTGEEAMQLFAKYDCCIIFMSILMCYTHKASNGCLPI